MTNILTAQAYRELAKQLTLPTQAFINGRYVPSQSGQTFTTINPVTGDVLADIASCNADDANIAVSFARDALNDGRWSKLAPAERKAILLNFADLLEKNCHELSVMESLDSGKSVSECDIVDIPDTINTIRWHAELIDKIYDSTAPTGHHTITIVVREAIGVVGLVLPWNFHC